MSISRLTSVVALALFCTAAFGTTAGDTAPDFTATDSNGKTVKLSDFKGKYVVLEWTNPECPFVQKFYNGKLTPYMQKEWATRGVVWLSINSTNDKSSEYKTGAKMNDWMEKHAAAQKAILIDGQSETAKLYGVKTTPEMFVINPQGTVIYAGAMDDKPSTRNEDLNGAKNYVRTALVEAMDGIPVSTRNTTPYGCSVKY